MNIMILLNKFYFDSDPAQFVLKLGACDSLT